jgi:opacity protein-like surface antigen
MKTAMVLIAFLAGSMNLSAQDRADLSLSGSVLSMNSITNNNITRSGSTAGGVLGSFRFWATSRNGFELNYGHATMTQTISAGLTKTSLDSGVHEVSGAYLFRPRTAGHLQPFFGAGAALLQFNPAKNAAITPAPQSQNKPGLLYVAGFDYVVNPHFALRAEFRGLVFAAPSFINETFRSNTTHQMSEPTFGIVYRF